MKFLGQFNNIKNVRFESFEKTLKLSYERGQKI